MHTALRLIAVLAFVFPQQTTEVALRQIVLTSEQEARDTRASLLAGASFDELAPRVEYMGRIRLSDLRIEVRRAIESLKAGDITNPVQIGNSYLLFQIVPEAEARWLDLDEAGNRALTDGRRADAIAQYQQALAHAEASALGDARVVRSLDSLATAYRLEGRAVDAEKLYRRAVALLEQIKPPELQIAQVVIGLGMALFDQGRFKEAEPLYLRARAIREKRFGTDHPEVAATVHRIAELYSAQGRFVEAAGLYDQSQNMLERTLGPNHPATAAASQGRDAFRQSLASELVERASIAAALLEFRNPKFVDEMRQLLALAPFSEDTYLRLKDVLLDAGLSEETEKILRTGLEKFPASRILRIYLADVMATTGRTQDALNLLQEASRLPRVEALDVAIERQQQGIIQQRIADMHLALAKFDDALASYRQALEIDPKSPGGRMKLGKAYLTAGRLEDAKGEFELAIRDTPDSSDVYLSLAETQLARSQWERAATAAQRAIDLNVSDSRALYLLGVALIRMGRTEQGQERLREFERVEAAFLDAEQRSREIRAVSIAAAAALQKGDADSAIDELSKGIARRPDADALHMNLAIVQIRLGRHEKAIETLESMLKLGAGQRFLLHKILAAEYEILGDTEASRRHRQAYLDSRVKK